MKNDHSVREIVAYHEAGPAVITWVLKQPLYRIYISDFEERSRVKIVLKGEQWRCHRPHPDKEARRYQVEEARELLERVGVDA